MARKKKVTITTTVEETVVTTGEKTHIICVLDRSGSMSSIMKDSIGGFNTFLKQQRKLPDDATITVALFDDKYELLYDNIDIKKVKDVTSHQWFPRGITALYDAVCKTINADKAKISKMKKKDRPNKVLVCVVTDGLENASKENSLDDTQKLIKKCEKDDWNFIYLAANQDAFAVGRSFGISGGNTFTYTATMDGVANMSTTLNAATASYRGMSSTCADFATLSKSLIEDDEKDEDDDVSGTITTSDSIGSVTLDNN
jgi:hypothetical protein